MVQGKVAVWSVLFTLWLNVFSSKLWYSSSVTFRWKKHSAIANLCFDKTARHLSFGEPSKQASSLTKTHEKELILKESKVDQVKFVEAFCMLRVAESDYSLTSCDNICKLFMWMFPGNISNPFQLGRLKASYVVSDEFSPCIQWRKGSVGY